MKMKKSGNASRGGAPSKILTECTFSPATAAQSRVYSVQPNRHHIIDDERELRPERVWQERRISTRII